MGALWWVDTSVVPTVAALLAALTLPACQRPTDEELTGGLRYIRDDRHDVCFALYSYVSSGATFEQSITYVPCDLVGLASSPRDPQRPVPAAEVAR